MDKSEATRTPAKRRKQVATVLRDAAALVERGWTQGQMARDTTGYRVFPHHPEAVCWCARGAMCRAANNKAVENSANRALSEHINGDEDFGVSTWNDDPLRDAEEVIAAMLACADRVERGEL